MIVYALPDVKLWFNSTVLHLEGSESTFENYELPIFSLEMNNLNYDKKLSEDFKLEICWFRNFYMFLACLSINKNYEMLNIQTTSGSKAFCRKLLLFLRFLISGLEAPEYLCTISKCGCSFK